jgi:hypothetical protein
MLTNQASQQIESNADTLPIVGKKSLQRFDFIDNGSVMELTP